ISNLILIPAQILFASIAVLAFYALELNTLGKPLGIRPLDLGRVFKLYTKQADHFHNLYMQCNNLLSNSLSTENFHFLKQAHFIIEDMYKNFEKKVSRAKSVQAKPSLSKSIFKKVCTGIAATAFGVLSALGAQTFIASKIALIIGISAASGPIGFGI